MTVIATILGGGAALLVLFAAISRKYSQTIGRRADRYDRLARLGTGAQLAFFTSVLGEPPAMQETAVKENFTEWILQGDPDYVPSQEEIEPPRRFVRREFIASLYIDRDFYVQAISDDDETVLAFSVTTRADRFRPVFQVLPRKGFLERLQWRRRHGEPYRPLVNIKLGHTTFADLDGTDPRHFAPPHFKISVGAHNHFYSEFDHYGNPGHYQWFVWTASDAARQGRTGRIFAVQEEVSGDEWPDPDKAAGEEPDWSAMPETQRFRHETVITTYTVVAGSLMERNYPLPRFGPHENDVRTLP